VLLLFFLLLPSSFFLSSFFLLPPPSSSFLLFSCPISLILVHSNQQHKCRESGPDVRILEEKDIDPFSQSDEVVVIGFFSDKKSPDYAVFQKVAREKRSDFLFGAHFGPVPSKHKVKPPEIVLYKQFDGGRKSMKGGLGVNEVGKFIEMNGTPLLLEYTPTSLMKVASSELPLAHFFVPHEDQNLYSDEIKKVARKFRKKVCS